MIPEVAKQKLADYIDVFCDKGFFTAKETCFKPIISSIKKQMRDCFSNKIDYLAKSRKCKELALSISHEARASKIKEILCS